MFKGLTKRRVAGGSVVLAFAAALAVTEFAEYLPSGDPSGYNGQKCDANGTDHTRLNYHSDKFRQLIESGEFNRGTWRLDAAVYRILGTPFVHTNIELIQEGRSEPVTTFDVWSLNDKTGDATLYASDERLAVVLDDCRSDNFVVKDNAEVARYTLESGNGETIFQPFYKMVVASSNLVERNITYTRFPDPANANETNSNGLPIALIEAADLPVPRELRGLYHGIYHWAPGRGDNVNAKVGKTVSQPGSIYDTIDALHLGRQQQRICLAPDSSCSRDFTR